MRKGLKGRNFVTIVVSRAMTPHQIDLYLHHLVYRIRKRHDSVSASSCTSWGAMRLIGGRHVGRTVKIGSWTQVNARYSVGLPKLGRLEGLAA